ncbi:class I SAM-dependent methyltransferase [Aliiglaciecola sp. CAU 1673]|uniref:class I SAM-dependent methyltransferase n=1 Tax=Aliiglaciecola sp. CAU 1673 TaxID=3032595 RepID=UPI0023DCB99F|nr:class I SAM-dependent methyltransferase [Aliiglaciecola sp. CAU 1673]MDF2178309.1 class I SAM-dependent methyltransferase [Aliiglaciecola sp. CAU 1673]
MKQKESFMAGEADAWFLRNTSSDTTFSLDDFVKKDPALVYLLNQSEEPGKVLEIGAANGYRLAAIKSAFADATCVGVEPSALAVEQGNKAYPNIDLRRGVASDLTSFSAGQFNTVIFGFCLYLCDREDLFKIAAEADRVLADGGRIIIWDFYSTVPFQNHYTPKHGLHSYKMDYAKMFLWNPAYSLEMQKTINSDPAWHPDHNYGLSVLRKRTKGAFIENPYSK